MSFKDICLGMIVISLIIILATFIILKRKKLLNEVAFTYGIFGSIFISLCSNFLISGGEIVYLIIDSLFMGMVFYNTVSMFGVRIAKIHENNNALISFFSGICIVGNIFTLFMLGVSGYFISAYASDPIILEYFDAETIEMMLDVFKVVLVDNGYLLLISIGAAIMIGYMAISMVSYATKNNTIKTILKSIFILSAFYAINLFVPATPKEGIIAVVAYIAVLFASYILYKESKHDKPSIEIVIK